MRHWDASRVARAAGAELLREPEQARGGPVGASVDTRTLKPGELYVGLRGERADGGAFAPDALAAGAWGVLVTPEHAGVLAAGAAGSADARGAPGGAVLAHPRPLAGLQALARAWRAELRERGARVVAITGSTGKTSTKDILAALLAGSLATVASPQNHNTEIGLPLALLGAGADAEAVVLEMAMRARGQIAELAAIAQPDVGVIVNIGPAHLELLGSLEAIAAAKAELIGALEPHATIVVPAGEPLLAPHLRADLKVVSFGDRGDVSLRARRDDGTVVIDDRGEEIVLRPSFGQAHNIRNLLAAVAAARALGCTPRGALEVSFSSMRGQRIELGGGAVLIDDCYNANPMSMCAAIDDLAASARGRRVAVLGEMLELGSEAPRLHREIGRHASARGVELLIAVGPLAREIASAFAGDAHAVADAEVAAALAVELVRDGDLVLVKGSRAVGLERVVQALARRSAARPGERAGGGRSGEDALAAQHTGAGQL